MSKNLTEQPTSQNDEIDLGQLFKLIGNAFDRFFRFIGNIFKWIFHLFIRFFVFLRKHLLKFAIAAILGVAIGWYLDSTTPTVYVSNMVVEPNFDSVQQLYNNITFYNELAESEDTLALSQVFKNEINTHQASSILEFDIESFSDENQKLKLFDEFVMSLDTTTRKIIDYKDYLKNFNASDARFHKITVYTTNNSIAKKLQNPIVSAISNNQYFKVRKAIHEENLKLNDSLYVLQLEEVENLQEFYKKIKLEEASKDISGTHISVSDSQLQDNQEIQLLNKIDDIQNKLVNINKERADKQEIVNVISNFPDKGVIEDNVLKKKSILFALLFLVVTFIILILLEFNSYLKNYNKNLKKE